MRFFARFCSSGVMGSVKSVFPCRKMELRFISWLTGNCFGMDFVMNVQMDESTVCDMCACYFEYKI